MGKSFTRRERRLANELGERGAKLVNPNKTEPMLLVYKAFDADGMWVVGTAHDYSAEDEDWRLTRGTKFKTPQMAARHLHDKGLRHREKII